MTSLSEGMKVEGESGRLVAYLVVMAGCHVPTLNPTKISNDTPTPYSSRDSFPSSSSSLVKVMSYDDMILTLIKCTPR